MDEKTVQKVATNLRNPLYAKQRIHFTSRAVLFVMKLFTDKKVDIIDLHSILLRIAHVSGCLDDSSKYINLKILVSYLCINKPSCISNNDIYSVSETFNIDQDGDYGEVEDMKSIISSIYK